MKTNTEIQNAQIGTLIQEFTGQAVAFYDGMKDIGTSREADDSCRGASGTGSVFRNAPGHLFQYDSRTASPQLFLRSVHGVSAFLDGRCHDWLL